MYRILASTIGALLVLTSCMRQQPEERVHRLLTDRIQTLATAESCTGGTIAARFTAMPGASAYFKCGVVTYSLDAKQGGTPEYPVGSVWIAVSSPLRTTARLIHAKGDRTQIIRKAGTAAIELLEEELLAAQPDK